MFRGILAVLSWLYAAGVSLRNAAFAAGLLRTVKAGVPVISVGNITAGGTGKTPLVEYLIRYCTARGKVVAVVSRGYGRTSRGLRIVSDGRSLREDAGGGGDEPVQMALKFPGLRVVVAERRVDAALTAVRDLGAEVIVMDDGFQHRYLHRDLDIVIIDGRVDVRREPLLPLGRRREPLGSLRRASLIVFSHLPAAEGPVQAGAMAVPYFSGVTAKMHHTMDGVWTLDGCRPGGEVAQGGTGLAFCGIGGPEGFLATLREAGLRIAGHAWFPDHHRYSPADVRGLQAKAEALGASYLVTTEKDAVRLRSRGGSGQTGIFRLPVLFLRIAISVSEGEGEVLRAVDLCLGIGGGSGTPAAR